MIIFHEMLSMRSLMLFLETSAKQTSEGYLSLRKCNCLNGVSFAFLDKSLLLVWNSVATELEAVERVSCILLCGQRSLGKGC